MRGEGHDAGIRPVVGDQPGGVAGFGDSPELAYEGFNYAWRSAEKVTAALPHGEKKKKEPSGIIDERIAERAMIAPAKGFEGQMYKDAWQEAEDDLQIALDEVERGRKRIYDLTVTTPGCTGDTGRSASQDVAKPSEPIIDDVYTLIDVEHCGNCGFVLMPGRECILSVVATDRILSVFDYIKPNEDKTDWQLCGAPAECPVRKMKNIIFSFTE